jgi:predicted dehydrogenase
MGRKHVQVIRELELDLVGIVDLSPQSLLAAKLEHNLSNSVLFDEPDKLFASVVVDCLIIATTADSHCALTCIAAKHGVKFILVEKPMAVSLEQCEKMIVTCQRYGAVLSINHQMRYMEQYSIPKSLLCSDAYGGFKSMTVVGGNIGISMNGAHYLEAFRFMSDEDPFEVTAWFDPGIVPNPRGMRFEDRAGSMRVTTASGKRLYLEIGSEQGHGLNVIYSGRNGLIFINELTGTMLTNVRDAEFRTLPTTRYGMPAGSLVLTISPAEVIHSTALLLTAMLQDGSYVSGEQGMMTIKVLAAAYLSSENGNVPIRVNAYSDNSRIFPWA